MERWLILGAAIALVAAACASADAPPISPTPTGASSTSGTWSPTVEACAGPGESGTCSLDGYPDRPYEVFVPGSYRSGEPVPVVIAFHGGGGSSQNGTTMSCPGGDIADPGCLHGVGEREGFVTVYPNGTGFPPLRRLRTWNAGGGSDGWNCASGKACERDVDDVGYVDRLIEDLGAWLNVDQSRVYATGLSNGAAFSHRLACERSGTFAAIAAVAGSNQFSTSAPCEPERPVAVLQVHGTDDPCWSYETSNARCLGNGGDKLGALESVTGWATRDGCVDEPGVEHFPDLVDDGTVTTATRWTGCDGGVEVLLLTIVGGGHTWPNGSPALSSDRVGRTTQDWGSEELWGFLSRFTLSEPDR